MESKKYEIELIVVYMGRTESFYKTMHLDKDREDLARWITQQKCIESDGGTYIPYDKIISFRIEEVK